jgi:hypothetical protein
VNRSAIHGTAIPDSGVSMKKFTQGNGFAYCTLVQLREILYVDAAQTGAIRQGNW